MELTEAMSLVNKGISAEIESREFKAVIPEGKKSGELPAFEGEKETYLLYKGASGYIKVSFSAGKAYFLVADPVAGEEEPEYVSTSVTLFNPNTADDKDIKYLINEYNDCIADKFKKKTMQQKISDVKLPPPVSKASAKNGASFYDPSTLASRYTVMYPELRDEYKRNIKTYGQFLPDEFFREFGGYAVDTIKQNDKQQMKKLFNMFNDIYLDGTNETQSIIVVTILGKLENDTDLLANCVDYMDPDLAAAVINVNKYLASRAGKKAKFALENPPAYKPPKQSRALSQSRL